MKKIFLISVVLLNAVCYKAEAQVSVNINIGRQPIWGPTGYDYVNYYYLPDLDVYYDVPRGMFVYFDLGRWHFGASLPERYGRYDLYNSYKVVVNERNPWLRHTYYRSQYAGYRGRHQPLIRDSHDQRYFAGRERHEKERYNTRKPVGNNRGNDNHKRFNDHGNRGRDNGRGNGGRNNGHGNGGKGHDKGHDGGDDGRGDDRDHGRHH